MPPERLEDPNYLPAAHYWVPRSEVEQRLAKFGWDKQWLIGLRDVTDARASERTVIASVLPREGVGHTVSLIFCAGHRPDMQACLLANLCCLTLDYIARQKVSGLHLTYSYIKQLAILPPDVYSELDVEFVVPRVLELTYSACDMTSWARDLGHEGPPFRWHSDRRAILRAELDAYYARLYGLTRDELRYILDPADVMGPGYPSETFRVLKDSEQRKLGEFRTRRLVLEAWDRLFGAH